MAFAFAHDPSKDVLTPTTAAIGYSWSGGAQIDVDCHILGAQGWTAVSEFFTQRVFAQPVIGQLTPGATYSVTLHAETWNVDGSGHVDQGTTTFTVTLPAS